MLIIIGLFVVVACTVVSFIMGHNWDIKMVLHLLHYKAEVFQKLVSVFTL